MGSFDGKGREEIDAEGLVTPAWVDIHTHFDGQVTWDDAMLPSSGQGVGTIVMGNCGVGFAPVAPGEKDLIELMEGVEDVPGTALYERHALGCLVQLSRISRLPRDSGFTPWMWLP